VVAVKAREACYAERVPRSGSRWAVVHDAQRRVDDVPQSDPLTGRSRLPPSDRGKRRQRLLAAWTPGSCRPDREPGLVHGDPLVDVDGHDRDQADCCLGGIRPCRCCRRAYLKDPLTGR
jgi:hypothetical protein